MLKLRNEVAVEASGQQPGFEFSVIAPEPSIDVKSKRDKGRVFSIHSLTEPPAFHPGADGDDALFDEGNAGKEFAEAIEQFVFGKLRGGGDAFLVLEQFDHDEARGKEPVDLIGQNRFP